MTIAIDVAEEEEIRCQDIDTECFVISTRPSHIHLCQLHTAVTAIPYLLHWIITRKRWLIVC